MQPASPDLDAYCARIGYTGPREPSLAVLHALHFQHVCHVPFENLDVLLGRPVRMDLPALEEKIVRQRRGGYCFEQNTFFAAILRTLGFSVTPLLARVRWQMPPDVRTPLTHMVLRVDLAGRPWLADVGFGSGPTAPLALDTAADQATTHEVRRIVAQAGKFTHQLRTPEGWAEVYEFSLEEPAPIDFELGNWYSCTHPGARFTNHLVVARAEPDRRVAIVDRELIIRDREGVAEKREIASPEELLALLARHFDLHLPPGTRIAAPAAPWPA